MRRALLQWFERKWLALRAAPRAATRGPADASTTAHAPPAGDDDERDACDASDDADFFPAPVRLEIEDVFDLHSIAPRDVERVVEEYLLEARRAGFRSVRIIHGKGRGVQRRLVQSILARTPFVRDWTDAPPQSGGWGATVAHLSIEAD